MAMRMIAILSLIREPAVRPDLGGSQNLRTRAEDDAHGFVIEA
jgi:hypothetical protein